MADIDLTAAGASYTFDDGAIFERVTASGSGTGNYDPFLTIQQKDTEAGYNTDETKQLDNVDGGDRTTELLLSSIPIKVVDGVAYYEFRVDLNEDNNDPLISIERLELYTSSAGATSDDFQGLAAADAFTDDFTKVFDLDSGGDNRLVLSDVTSSGSGTDDYRFLVPVSAFGDVDPSTTYVTMFTVMGLANDALDTSATFEEWNTELAAVINGVKFEDLNHNGIQDNGEQGLGGVTVFIDADRDGVLDSGEVSTTTASDGTFHFYSVTSNYADGDVWVDEVVPDGYEQTTGDHTVVDVSDGGQVSAAIGNAPLPGEISGTKTADTDNNDSGDTPVGGWTVYLYEDDNGNGVIDAGDDQLAFTTTAADGSYSFTGLTPGDYIVEEETQSGWHNVTATTVGVTIAPGGEVTVDFVNEQLGSISGTKTADTDNNDSGDTAVDGWNVYLYEDDNGNGVIDAGDDQIATTKTVADGSYSFEDVAPGTYIVEEETRSGWHNITATTVGVTVTAGGEATADFVNEQLGSIAGTKMADTDNNDSGDTAVDGWNVYLYEDDNGNGVIDAGDDQIATTKTVADGSYSFEDVAPGTYIVEEETRSGWHNITATTVGVTVTAGGEATADFVNEQLGSISGTKMEDTDNNGSGDSAVLGWTVYLYEDDNGNGVIDAGDDQLGFTTTAADGSYSFDDLAPGTYIVQEESQSGWQAVTDATVGVTVTAGGEATADFVNERLASMSGYKFADLNNNGVWDQGSGENGISGWSISLYHDDGDGVLDAGDTLADSTTTDSNGYYEFTDLAPGEYIIVEGSMTGWVQTAPNGSDADPESGDVNGGGSGYGEYGYAIDLMGGDDNGDNDFGNYLVPGPGVRTPGFWGSPNGLKFWDGIVGNETKSGPNFPSGELAPDGFLILCDDGDGVLEDGELGISLADAQKIINASNKDGAGQGFMLARDVIATTLNALAGNPIGDVSDECSPAYWLCEGVDWLIKYENNDNSGSGDFLTFADLKSHNITGKSAAWNVGVSDDGIEAGKDIHSALDEYNNTGMHCGIQYATDGDSEVTTFEMQYNTMLQSSDWLHAA